ncbi:hypothetical protein, partial [Mycoplasma columborale]
DDVNTFKDHIVCDSNSKSEVVIPVIVKNKLFAVLDIDAPVYKRFDTQTVKSLEEIVSILEHELEKLL